MDRMERGPLPIAAHPVAMVQCQNPNQRYYDDSDSDDLDVNYMDLRKNKSRSINHIVRDEMDRRMGVYVTDNNRNGNSMNEKRKGYFGNVGISDEVEEEGGSELAGEIRGFAERFMRMESKKIEMMKETQRYRMEMEKRRMEMILETQRNLIDTIHSVVGSHKKRKV
ncbi:unnamed protein product [Withania somnifera]